jgi:hypothetical protein
MFLFSLFHSYGQDKKDLKLSLSTGSFNSTYYTNAKSRQFYNFGFEYSVTKRRFISADFTSGQHRYYDNIRSDNAIPLTTPGYEKHTNAEARSMLFSVLYKYKLLDNRKFSINAGAGIGIITETFTYPVNIANGGFTFETSGGKGGVCFPFRLDIDYQFLNQFQIGLIAGTYFHPDHAPVGQHLGIRFSYILK